METARLGDIFLEDALGRCWPTIFAQCSVRTLVQLYLFAAGCQALQRRKSPLRIAYMYQHVVRPMRRVKRKHAPERTTPISVEQWASFVQPLKRALQAALPQADALLLDALWMQLPGVGMALLAKHFSLHVPQHEHAVDVPLYNVGEHHVQAQLLPCNTYADFNGLRLLRYQHYYIVRQQTIPRQEYCLTGAVHVVLSNINIPHRLTIYGSSYIVLDHVYATDVNIRCDGIHKIRCVFFYGCTTLMEYETRFYAHTLIIDHCHQPSDNIHIIDSIRTAVHGELVILRNIPEEFVLPEPENFSSGNIIAVMGCPRYLIPAGNYNDGYGSASFRKRPQVRISGNRMAARVQTPSKQYTFYRIQRCSAHGEFVYCRAKLTDILARYRQHLALIPRAY